jgi:hypothetical protein
MEPSQPAFSTPITLHNYWPGYRAIKRPLCFRPAFDPIEMGTSWAETGAHERRRWLERGHQHAALLQWLPSRTAALWKVFSGLDESKEPISQRLAAVLEQHTLHNYGLFIRTAIYGLAVRQSRRAHDDKPPLEQPRRPDLFGPVRSRVKLASVVRLLRRSPSVSVQFVTNGGVPPDRASTTGPGRRRVDSWRRGRARASRRCGGGWQRSAGRW